MKKVQVLLSTYNGEKYLTEQLDSIINQSYTNITVLIRDDGSSDGTIRILESYKEQYKWIEYYIGENLGAKDSFLDLIKHADLSMDFFAFADQDDVWLPNKIKQAVEKLTTMDQSKPLLYCGNKTLVDEKLVLIHSSIKEYNIRPSFGNALVENICTGCTSVMNIELLSLIRDNLPKFVIMHDWWFYLVASNFGEIYYDNESYILYRQHSNNVVGARSNYLDEFRSRVKDYKCNRGKVSRQAYEFHRLYHKRSKNIELQNYVIKAKKSLKYRITILNTNKIYRQRKIDNFIFKVLFLLGSV